MPAAEENLLPGRRSKRLGLFSPSCHRRVAEEWSATLPYLRRRCRKRGTNRVPLYRQRPHPTLTVECRTWPPLRQLPRHRNSNRSRGVNDLRAKLPSTPLKLPLSNSTICIRLDLLRDLMLPSKRPCYLMRHQPDHEAVPGVEEDKEELAAEVVEPREDRWASSNLNSSLVYPRKIWPELFTISTTLMTISATRREVARNPFASRRHLRHH